ncbi:response regulator receiver protein [Gloeothece citriformis PCC 7424]|uniref:Response regulator receiver protein n=1 Tax=Gloeothece citriformis (strain PCC 7424) TaxID=65393 RepID=B7KI69_GLOC7|nr:response regulator [Gloeothece citriformis]ACK73556.1 response regulator receiver protein [Gloeothece citriformis PCC 7424]
MSSHKILVIDDSKVIRMHVKDMLPAGNFEVVEAKDGVEGYNLIRSEHPYLIMLDFFLPKMSGWEVYQEIQKEQQLKSIPLVLMSGRKEEVVEKIPEPFEYFAFIEKPFDQKQLVTAIKEAMTKAKKRPVPATTSPTQIVNQADQSAMAAEIQALNDKISKMQFEIENLKKQVNQLVGFIKKKLM